MSANTNWEHEAASLGQFLLIYYKRLFPVYPYCKWLAYGEPGLSDTFKRREFSFTLENNVYIRYLSFSDHVEFERDLYKRCPHKIDIGAIYSAKPKDYSSPSVGGFQPVEKELVFDIDLTDYDDVRYCCSGSSVCHKCWPLMSVAIKIVDAVLRDDFGFQHILWVFSGRRGVHCWVCDAEARKLSNPARTAITEYLIVTKGGDSTSKRVNLRQPVHPSLQRAVSLIEEMFIEYACIQQDFLGTKEKMTKVANLVPSDYRENLLSQWQLLDDSCARWVFLTDTFNYNKNRANKSSKNNLALIPMEIMLQYCYPRLDANVSKSINHLLKSPFCVHPKTGMISVPMDASNIDDFDICNVPTVLQLIEDLDRNSESPVTKVKEYKNTRLKPYVEIFDRFVKAIVASNKENTLLQNDINGLFGNF